MITIDYDSILKRFELLFSFNSFSDQYEFNNFTSFLKSLFIMFDFEKKVWFFQYKRIDEVILWFEKFNIKYDITFETAEEIKLIKASYESDTKFSRKISIDYSILNKDVTLYEYQKEGINWRLSRSNYLDGDDAGTGKTIQNTLVFSQLFKQGKIDGIVIITPKGLSYHWKREILQFVNVFEEDDIQILDNTTKIQPFEKYVDKKIIICPDHLFSTCLLSYRKDFKAGKSQKKIQWKQVPNIKKLWKKKNLCILLDECHSAKNTEAIKTKALHSVRNQFDYHFLLSATPAINRFEDFYSQLSFVDNSIIKMSENAFKIWIAKEIGDKWSKYTITSYNADRVQQTMDAMKTFFIKRLKEDIPEMKVKKIIKELFVELHPLQRELYEHVCENEIELLEDEYDEITFSMIMNKLPIILEALDNPFLLHKRKYTNDSILKILKKWKLDYDNKFILLSSMLENYIGYQEKKVIIYGFHPGTLDMLNEQFKKYNPLLIHGQIKTDNVEKYRDEVQYKFNNDKEHKLLILSLLTSSAGLNLQKGGSNMIVYETAFDATLFRQAQDRQFRIVSERDALIEIFTYPYTLDKKRVDIVLNRSKLNDNMNKKISKEELRQMLNGKN